MPDPITVHAPGCSGEHPDRRTARLRGMIHRAKVYLVGSVTLYLLYLLYALLSHLNIVPTWHPAMLLFWAGFIPMFLVSVIDSVVGRIWLVGYDAAIRDALSGCVTIKPREPVDL